MPDYQKTFTETSNEISVAVKPVYLEDESSPVVTKHVFAYFIEIRNLGSRPARLLKRHWDIRDSCGENYEVDGDGVIGVQPTIEPGKEHKYNSFCVLKSYQGSMKGFYTMERQDGEVIYVRIPQFQLHAHVLN